MFPRQAEPGVHLNHREQREAAMSHQGFMSDEELVVLRRYDTAIEAEVAKSALESVGIGSIVWGDNEKNKARGTTFLLVRADDVDAASDVLGIEGIENLHKQPEAA